MKVVQGWINKSKMEVNVKYRKDWGTWVAPLVRYPTSAQVMISLFMGSSPAMSSVLTAWSLEPASDFMSSSPAFPLLSQK